MNEKGFQMNERTRTLTRGQSDYAHILKAICERSDDEKILLAADRARLLAICKAALSPAVPEGYVMVPRETFRQAELMLEVAATSGIEAFTLDGAKTPNAKICKHLSDEFERLSALRSAPPSSQSDMEHTTSPDDGRPTKISGAGKA